ncbi:hypothetical protein AMJ40_01330 [candidate division TA06 bacterium DG_26]|uniref:Uncharacterized protein n=1 Tax=candidate division TA06 bacterium DG_26 TaxID=1703771 RepID=A0A0S7WLF0_UNCT6|nr:MAG: hypothetical protein AMJ40_01330 [candidate division TA06 bacterium DG_26]
MENRHKELVEDLQNLGSTVTKLLKLLRTWGKLSQSSVLNTSRMESLIAQIDTLLGPEIPDVLRTELKSWLHAREIELGRLREEIELSFAKELSKLLEADGLTLMGQVPQFSVNFFTIHTNFAGDRASILFGPELLRSNIPLSADEVARTVKTLVQKFITPNFDGHKFAATLYHAYTRALTNRGKSEGNALPIVRVLSELSFLMQSPKFMRDPKKENFTGYGRVQFAYDLLRLRDSGVQSVEGRRWKLGVATFDRTGKKEDFIWVPDGTVSPEGTRYAWISFSD